MDNNKKALLFAIAEFLQGEMETIAPDSKESIEAAIQCLETAYGFETGEEEAKAMYSLRPSSLLDVFKAGQAQLAGGNKDGQVDEIPPPPSYTEVDSSVPEPTEADRAQADALKDQGNEEFKVGNYAGAVKLYSEAVSVCPTVAVYFVNRAAAYTKMEKIDLAIADCEKGISLDPTFARAYSRLGTCYYSQNKLGAAVEAYTKALQLEPDNKFYRENLNKAEAKLKQDGQAHSPPHAPQGGEASTRGMDAPLPGLGPDLDIGSLLSNPALMGMAQQFLQGGGMQQLMTNPAFQNMAQMMQGRAAGGQGASAAGQQPPLSEMMNDPAMQNAAKELRKQFGQQDPSQPQP